jgi:hypothetical protein
MAAKRTATPPRRLGVRGRALFDGVVGRFELDAYEVELLVQACHCADTMEMLQKQIDKDGPTTNKTLQGPVSAHPLLVELRAQQGVYVALLKALALPQGEAVVAERRPRRPRRTRFEMEKGQASAVSGGGA